MNVSTQAQTRVSPYKKPRYINKSSFENRLEMESHYSNLLNIYHRKYTQTTGGPQKPRQKRRCLDSKIEQLLGHQSLHFNPASLVPKRKLSVGRIMTLPAQSVVKTQGNGTPTLFFDPKIAMASLDKEDARKSFKFKGYFIVKDAYLNPRKTGKEHLPHFQAFNNTLSEMVRDRLVSYCRTREFPASQPKDHCSFFANDDLFKRYRLLRRKSEARQREKV